jgi:hypothetical protein
METSAALNEHRFLCSKTKKCRSLMKKTKPSVATNATIRKAYSENEIQAFLFNRSNNATNATTPFYVPVHGLSIKILGIDSQKEALS